MSLSNNNNTTAIINPKPCNYNCGTRIFWDTSQSSYLEVFTKQKHICPNRSNGKSNVAQSTTTAVKPNYYNKFIKQPKLKMSNSFELLTGSIDSIQKKYELLSDIVSEANGKVHGSQSHMITNNSMSLIVYYEVPEGNKREEVKQKFNIITKNQLIL